MSDNSKTPPLFQAFFSIFEEILGQKKGSTETSYDVEPSLTSSQDKLLEASLKPRAPKYQLNQDFSTFILEGMVHTKDGPRMKLRFGETNIMVQVKPEDFKLMFHNTNKLPGKP